VALRAFFRVFSVDSVGSGSALARADASADSGPERTMTNGSDDTPAVPPLGPALKFLQHLWYLTR
jgi:hypothetical protein